MRRVELLSGRASNRTALSVREGRSIVRHYTDFERPEEHTELRETRSKLTLLAYLVLLNELVQIDASELDIAGLRLGGISTEVLDGTIASIFLYLLYRLSMLGGGNVRALWQIKRRRLRRAILNGQFLRRVYYKNQPNPASEKLAARTMLSMSRIAMFPFYVTLGIVVLWAIAASLVNFFGMIAHLIRVSL